MVCGKLVLKVYLGLILILKKGKNFLNNNKDKFDNIFGVDISEEDVFNLIVIDFIKKISKGKTRLNLLRKLRKNLKK